MLSETAFCSAIALARISPRCSARVVGELVREPAGACLALEVARICSRCSAREGEEAARGTVAPLDSDAPASLLVGSGSAAEEEDPAVSLEGEVARAGGVAVLLWGGGCALECDTLCSG